MTKKPRMALQPEATPGLETDGKGNPVPFEKRTEDDKALIRQSVAAAMHGESTSIKDPENEAKIPAPHPDDARKGKD